MPETRRVLIADDNRDWVESLAAILRMQGHTVALAYDGVEAIECAGRTRPDVVIVDIHMPRLDGDTVARVLKRHPEPMRPTIIGVTGWPGGAKDWTRQCDGFDVVLPKPVDLDALLGLIERAAVLAPGSVASRETPGRAVSRT